MDDLKFLGSSIVNEKREKKLKKIGTFSCIFNVEICTLSAFYIAVQGCLFCLFGGDFAGGAPAKQGVALFTSSAGI